MSSEYVMSTPLDANSSSTAAITSAPGSSVWPTRSANESIASSWSPSGRITPWMNSGASGGASEARPAELESSLPQPPIKAAITGRRARKRWRGAPSKGGTLASVIHVSADLKEG